MYIDVIVLVIILVIAGISFKKYYHFAFTVGAIDITLRIANFINGELFGRISLTSPFAMVFPTDRLQMPRHPSQLYEAFLEGLVLFIIMLTLYKKTNIIKKVGLSSGIFGIFYSIMRFIAEFFRQPETPIDPLPITMGQLLSILFLLFCVCWIAFWNKVNKKYDK